MLESFDPSKPVTLGNLIDLSGTFESHILNPLNDFFDFDNTPTVEELAAHLELNSSFISNAQGTFDDDVMQVSVTFDIDRRIGLGLDLSDLLGGLLGDVEANSDQFELDLGMEFGLTFGLDLNTPGTANDQFFVKIDRIEPTLSLVADDIDFGVNIGILEAGVKGGSLELGIGLEIEFNNPDNDDDGRITRSELDGMLPEELASVNSDGNTNVNTKLIATLPVEASLGLFSTADLPTQPEIEIAIFGEDLFSGNFIDTITSNDAKMVCDNLDHPSDEGPSRICFHDFKELLDFRGWTSDGFLGLMVQLGDWLGQFKDTPVFDTKIPFTKNTTVGDALDLGTAFAEKVLHVLVDDEGVPTFTSAQTFASRLQEALGSSAKVDYDAERNSVLIDLDFGYSPDALKTELGFDVNLGNFVEFDTSTELALSAGIDVDLDLGIDLNPLSEVTEGTEVGKLNGGVGIKALSGKDDLLITLRDGSTAEVDLHGAETVGDVISRLSGAAGGITAKLATDEETGLKHIEVIDSTTGDGTFTIEAANDSVAGFALGLLGEGKANADGKPAIMGAMLSADSIIDRLFIRDTSKIGGTFGLTASDIDAEARLGFLGVQLGNGDDDTKPAGNGAISTTIEFGINDPDSGSEGPIDHRIYFRELQEGLFVADVIKEEGKEDVEIHGSEKLISGPILTGSAELFLPISPKGEFLKNVVGDKEPSVQISWSKVFVQNDDGKPVFNTDPGSEGGLVITTNDFDDLLNFEDMDFGTIIAALEDLANFLGTLEGLDFLQDEIPLINVKPAELIGFVGKFREFIFELKNNPVNSIEKIETGIKDVLNLSDNALKLTLLKTETGNVLRIDLNYKPTFEEDHNLNINLDEVLPDGLDRIVDVEGQAALTVKAGADLNLAFGIDLGNLDGDGKPRTFLFGGTDTDAGTRIDLIANAVAADVNFDASIGPFGAFIRKGSAGISQNETKPNDPARFGFTFDSLADSEGRIYLGDLGGLNFNDTLTIEGQIFADLPINFPNDSSPIINLLSESEREGHSSNIKFTFDLKTGTLIGEPTAPPFNKLLDNLNISDLLNGLVGGFDNIMMLVEDFLGGEVFGIELPFIGNQFSDAARFVEDIRAKINDNFINS